MKSQVLTLNEFDEASVIHNAPVFAPVFCRAGGNVTRWDQTRPEASYPADFAPFPGGPNAPRVTLVTPGDGVLLCRRQFSAYFPYLWVYGVTRCHPLAQLIV